MNKKMCFLVLAAIAVAGVVYITRFANAPDADLAACDSMPDKYTDASANEYARQDCRDKVAYNRAVEAGDIGYCETWTGLAYIGCVNDIAASTKNTEYCKKLDTEAARASCVKNISNGAN